MDKDMQETRQAWGKTGGVDGNVHPLAHHSMDVAAVFMRMTQLPIIRDRLAAAAKTTLTDTQCQRLAVLVFLHDIGKLHPGFQAKGWPPGLWCGPTNGHLKEGWAFLMLAFKWPKHPFHETMQQIKGWGQVAVNSLIAAAIAHHGRPVEPPSAPTLEDWDYQPTAHYNWRVEAHAMKGALHRWFAGAFYKETKPLPDAPRLHHLVAGLASLSDWIGSDTRFFKFAAPFDCTYDATAHDRAMRALATVGIDPETFALRHAPEFAELTDKRLTPNPAQVVVGAVEPKAQLVILEAETGSGKTEAALWRFTQLFAAGAVSGLYFAVPTRSAARQLHRRVNAALGRVFGSGAPEAVLAIPGMLRAGESEGRSLPHWKVRWEDRTGSVPARWAAEHATRFLAAPVAVGTVDQATLAGLRVKHAHLRGSALNRSLLVIDEVHASDRYMTEILKRLLNDHLDTGGYAMLMSATLGARARVRWSGGTCPDFKAASATPYPAVWVAGENAPRAAKHAGQPRTIHVETVPTMDEGESAKQAISAAEQDARVLVIRNTVSMAVATWRAVRETGKESLLMQAAGHPALHHGRFAVEDRALLDRAVETALAPDRARERRGCIVIGTQTLEQSLDIDADLLITDLCPMDVLLQRIGRLHRHDLLRPVRFKTARVSVLLPERGLDHLTAPRFENGLGGWDTRDGLNGIYRDLAGLELTRRLLATRCVWRIPERNRALVEGATHPDRISELIEEKGKDWDRYDRRFGGAEAAAGMIAGLNVLDRAKPFNDSLLFPDADERIMTRLGEEGAILTLEPSPAGPFGQSVTRIALPARWSRGIAEGHKVTVEQDGGDLVLSVAEKIFSYSLEGLRKTEGA